MALIDEAEPAALELYEALVPAFEGDEVLALCMALTTGNLERIHLWVTDQEDRPGWQILLDPERAPAEVLPWLAQFDGAFIRPDMNEEAIRDAIRSPQGFGRGTVAQIEEVAKRRLTGTKYVKITERYTGNAWRLLVQTLTAETPEPTKTKQEIEEEAKPIGILLFMNSSPAWNWQELRSTAAYNTWLKLRTELPTWLAVRTHEP